MFNEIGMHIKNNSKVISLEHGIGEITGNFSMYDGVDDYLEVVYLIDSKTRYFCIKHKSDIRLISSRESIESALNLMNLWLNDSSIENDFSESRTRFLDKNALFIVKRIVELFRRNLLSIEENLLLESSIDSLIHEIEEVYSVDEQCARGIVSDYLKCA